MAKSAAPKLKQMSSVKLREEVKRDNKYSWKAAAELTRRGHPVTL